MSIINDALKKADHLKRAKTFGGEGLNTESQNQALLTEEPKIAIPRVFPRAPGFSNIPKPIIPFRVHFENKAQPSKIVHQLSTRKIILIVAGTCALFAVLLFPIFRGLLKSNKTVEIAPKSVQSVNAQPVVLHSQPPVAKPQYREYGSNEAANVSFKPIPRTLKEIPIENQYHLSGISTMENKRYALINGLLTEVGATVDGAEVIAIEKQIVTLKKSDKEFTIKLAN